MVGAVIVRDDQIVGEGYHARVGGPHAEVVALEEAGSKARGATLYVTLEPCAHHGRTPPCADAVLAAGVKAVVACHPDPNPNVRGAGFAKLRAGNVEVEWGSLEDEAIRLNLRYLVPVALNRPLVTLKWAMSLDGKVATASGESQWISSPKARRHALDLRELHDAIVIGSGTVLADDPRLNRRLGHARGSITRVVVDRRLRTSPNARMFDIEGPVLLYTEQADGARRRALESRGATVAVRRRVTPKTVLDDLYERSLRSVLVEGGPTLAGAFFQAGLFDRVEADLAPLLLGGERAASALGGEGVERIDQGHRLEALKTRRRGGDVWIEGLRAGCLRELSSKSAV